MSSVGVQRIWHVGVIRGAIDLNHVARSDRAIQPQHDALIGSDTTISSPGPSPAPDNAAHALRSVPLEPSATTTAKCDEYQLCARTGQHGDVDGQGRSLCRGGCFLDNFKPVVAGRLRLRRQSIGAVYHLGGPNIERQLHNRRSQEQPERFSGATIRAATAMVSASARQAARHPGPPPVPCQAQEDRRGFRRVRDGARRSENERSQDRRVGLRPGDARRACSPPESGPAGSRVLSIRRTRGSPRLIPAGLSPPGIKPHPARCEDIPPTQISSRL
jgi:hypothetical protein